MKTDSGLDIVGTMTFKRSQVEGALRALLSGPPATVRDRISEPVTPDFSIRLRRLLEIDRLWGQANPDHVAELGLAFYDAMPGGKGQDVSYSAQRAFNLAIAMQLVAFGFKQKEVVEQVALLQPKLQQAFETALTKRRAGTRRRETDRTGHSGSAEPVFLLVRRVEASARIAARSEGTIADGEVLIDPVVCVGWARLQNVLRQGREHLLGGVFLIELSELAVQLESVLSLQPVKRRGRRPR